MADRYQQAELPCLSHEWRGAPLCPAGKPEGTPVKTYPYAWCNVDFQSDQRKLADSVASSVGTGNRLFAVYKPKQVPGLPNMTAAYAVVFGDRLEAQAPTLYLDKDGRVLLLRTGCGTAELAVPTGAEPILAPKAAASAAKRSEAEAGLSALVNGEVEQMHRALRAALGEYDPCAGATKGCIMDTGLASVVEVAIARCDKVGPDAQMNGYQATDRQIARRT